MKAAARPGALVVALLVNLSRAALSVLPHQSDSIVLSLRDAIVIDDRDLIGPAAPRSCSSLHDGPSCGLLRATRGQLSGEVGDPIVPRPDPAARLVADGVLSNILFSRYKEAFNWDASANMKFGSAVSQMMKRYVLSDMIAQKSRTGHAVERHSGSQCFRLRLDRLRFSSSFRRLKDFRLVKVFCAGVPRALGLRWVGQWSVHLSGEPARGTDIVGNTHLKLRSAWGGLRFAQPVIVQRLAIEVPAQWPESQTGSRWESWAAGCRICGRAGTEVIWCTSVDKLAAVAQEAAAIAAPGGRAARESLVVDVGNAFSAVDEITIAGVPRGGLRLVLADFVTTLPTHSQYGPGHSTHPVVLLQRPQTASDADLPAFQPRLEEVSRDAAVWDVNEVILHNMAVRENSNGAPAAKVRVDDLWSEGGELENASLFINFLAMLQREEVRLPRSITRAKIDDEAVILAKNVKRRLEAHRGSVEELIGSVLRKQSLTQMYTALVLWRRWRLKHGARAVPWETSAVVDPEEEDDEAATLGEALEAAVEPLQQAEGAVRRALVVTQSPEKNSERGKGRGGFTDFANDVMQKVVKALSKLGKSGNVRFHVASYSPGENEIDVGGGEDHDTELYLQPDEEPDEDHESPEDVTGLASDASELELQIHVLNEVDVVVEFPAGEEASADVFARVFEEGVAQIPGESGDFDDVKHDTALAADIAAAFENGNSAEAEVDEAKEWKRDDAELRWDLADHELDDEAADAEQAVESQQPLPEGAR